MRFEFHHYFHLSPETSGVLGEIRSDLKRLIQMGTTQMTDLTRITEEVTQMQGTVASAVTLLGQLAELIRQNATDPAALNALADQLDADGNALAEAVAANTPS